jgi:release factor glutamine methyltransferase
VLLPDEQIRYRRFLEKRAASYPLQYLLGEVCFRGLLVKVGEGVLIPRPETEFLMDALGELFDARKEFRALDVGTGSGNLALSIASEFPLADVIALDLSDSALALARENAGLSGLAGRVRFLKSDLFEGLPEGPAFDCILSNPPYVAAREKDQLSKELGFEPAEALFGGEDGLSVIERILDGAGGRLGAGGYLLLEMGAGQRETISRYAGRRGFDTLSVRKDYSGIERIITLRKRTWKN